MDKLLRDDEAKPNAVCVKLGAFFDLAEQFEKSCLVRVFEADASVFHFDFEELSFFICDQLHCYSDTTFLSKLQTVRLKVEQDLDDAAFVHPDEGVNEAGELRTE